MTYPKKETTSRKYPNKPKRKASAAITAVQQQHKRSRRQSPSWPKLEPNESTYFEQKDLIYNIQKSILRSNLIIFLQNYRCMSQAKNQNICSPFLSKTQSKNKKRDRKKSVSFFCSHIKWFFGLLINKRINFPRYATEGI